MHDSKDDSPIFSLSSYREEHHDVIRSDEWEKKNLPKSVRPFSVQIPVNVICGNLFLFNTRNKEWLLDDFPIFSRWMPSCYSMTYTGPGLDTFDLEMFISISKLMEQREVLNKEFIDDYAEAILSSDIKYQSMTEDAKKVYKENKIENLNLSEGIFLHMPEFLRITELTKGGKTVEMVKESLSKLSRGTLKITAEFDDDREDFVVNDQIIHFVYLPKKDGFFISFTPMMLDMFSLKTSNLNTYVMRNISIKSDSREKIDTNLYTTLVTYAREQVWSADIDEFLIKSPYYLMQQRHLGNIPSGKIVPVNPDGKVDETGISLKNLNNYISNARRDIKKFFERLEDLDVIRTNITGRGNSTRIQFQLPRSMEKIATDSIKKVKLQKQLEIDI